METEKLVRNLEQWRKINILLAIVVQVIFRENFTAK